MSLVDVETIMLLLGMMSIVVILRKSGIFTLLSVKIAQLTQGSPLKILILFSAVTATMSAFLDNVTTVLIIIPIIVELTAGMGLNPRLFVISQAIISNIGGTATLIGDPPNIIIGSKVGLCSISGQRTGKYFAPSTQVWPSYFPFSSFWKKFAWIS